MAGQISVEPDTLRQHAKVYSNAGNTVTQVLNSVTRESQQMEQDWKGQASASYQAQFQQLVPQVKKFIELMNQINGQLNSAANQIEQNDQQLSKGFGFK